MSMNDSDKIKMEINIAGEHIQLSAPFNRQDLVRDAEREINELFSSLKQRFITKSDREILAMIAYQYASYYQELLSRYRLAAESLQQSTDDLDAILSRENATDTPPEA